MKRIVASAEFVNEIDYLIAALISKEYFSEISYAIEYTYSIQLFIETNINIYPSKKAPSIFSKYGKDLKYITYVHSSRTTWYILFEETEDTFFLRHITNNHVSGQYFNI